MGIFVGGGERHLKLLTKQSLKASYLQGYRVALVNRYHTCAHPPHHLQSSSLKLLVFSSSILNFSLFSCFYCPCVLHNEATMYVSGYVKASLMIQYKSASKVLVLSIVWQESIPTLCLHTYQSLIGVFRQLISQIN